MSRGQLSRDGRNFPDMNRRAERRRYRRAVARARRFVQGMAGQPYRYNGGEADLTGFMDAIRNEIDKRDPWARRTSCTPVEAAEWIGRALFDTYTEMLLYDLIEQWQACGGGTAADDVLEFLGMSWDEYARWVECRMPADERAA
ncbi:hypothetical protein NWFMUON74_61220 [Nocardia wallacei]|uniref:Uncharacterized protein n=2 Tax=Nocardia wallacei TaxID=480035 RepID=A0A7G1KT58_9NOCA|nr:hypothetical protein NWFMUON74_61220 [Nocardia wallacei]